LTLRQPAVSERQRLERIADEYRSRGYDVLVEPLGPELPPFLGNHRPDLIARKGDEGLVIEVKHSPAEGESTEIGWLAERIRCEPGWRLVVVAQSPAEELVPGERLSLLSDAEVEQHLNEASRLLASGQQEAALLLAWASIEAQLRQEAKREDIPLPRPDTLTLLRQLVSHGLVDRDEHNLLTSAFRARSAVAHGFQPPGDIEPIVHTLLDLSANLRREANPAEPL